MAQERIYQPQVGPAQPVALPGASPAAFGSEIGGAVARLSETMHRNDLRAYEIERRQQADTEASAAAVAMANAQLLVSEQRDKARAAPGPGAAGHTEGRAADFDAATKGIVDSITDSNVRRSVATQIAERRAGFIANEHAWQVATATRMGVDNLKTAGDRYSSFVYSSADPDAASIAHRAIDDMVDAQQGIGEFREPVRRELHQQVALSHAKRMQDTDPNGLIVAIDQGSFSDVLNGDQLEALRGGATIEIRRIEATKRAEAAAALAEKREALATRRAELDAGAGTPQERFALARDLEAIGDRSGAIEQVAKGGSEAAAAAFKGAPPAELDRQIAPLENKKSASGLSIEEAAKLDGLTELRAQTVSRLNQPGGALATYLWATGRTLPPLDPSDGDAMQRRAKLAAAAAAQYGRAQVEPITETELPTFKDLMGQGAAGKVRALQAIRAFGDPRAIAGAARQMAGNDDAEFRIAATLAPDVARDVLMGAEIQTANPGMWNADGARRMINRHYRGMLRWLPEQYQADLLAATRNYFLTQAQRGGETKWDDKRSPGLVAQALHRVMGEANGRGGILRRSDGIVLVPPTMTPAQLDSRFASAKLDQYRAAANGRLPAWGDGKVMSEPEFKRLLPTAIGGGRYVFRGPDGRAVHDDKGRTYVIALDKLTP